MLAKKAPTAAPKDAERYDWYRYLAYHHRWTGFVQPAFPEKYDFIVEVNDGARLWIGETLMFDNFDEVRTCRRCFHCMQTHSSPVIWKLAGRNCNAMTPTNPLPRLTSS